MGDSFLNTYLPYQLRKADQLLSAAFYDRLVNYDVNQSEWRVLAVLHETGSMSIRELTATALSPQPTITHAVSRLEERGLVERVPGTHDKRQRFVSMTRPGRALAGKLIAEAKRLEVAAMQDHTSGDPSGLASELRSLCAAKHSLESTGSPSLVTPRGAFPHVRVANGFAFISGTSSRQPDNTFAGVSVDELGTTAIDIGAQTTAVLENVESILATVGLDRWHLVDTTVFLVNMNDFGGYNEAWAHFFANTAGHAAPARTTVAAHQLPHPHLLIEIKATAVMASEAM